MQATDVRNDMGSATGVPAATYGKIGQQRPIGKQENEVENLRARMRRTVAFFCATMLLMAFTPWLGPPAQAATGDTLRTIIADRTGTDCASTNPSGGHSSVGVGVAFDGTNLLISCVSDNTITAVDPADGSQEAIHQITGASSLGALAWDNGRKLLWACSNFNDVGTIDLSTNVFTYVFTSQGCFDGLAYDATDDTLWSSADVSGSVQHYTTAGSLLGSSPVSLGSCGNSGIAVGGEKLYLANNGCSEIYEVAKDFSSSNLFAAFPARLEDLECDNITFAGAGSAAIWSIDAYDNILNAFEIPNGACLFGGGGEPPNEPPDCSLVAPSTAALWPPNHKLRTITLSGASDPEGGPVTLTITGVTQDEPVNGLGDGDTSPDAQLGAADNEVQLRAERSGTGDGRVYRIAFTGTDEGGATCSGVATVAVPHDQRGAPAVDSGGVFDSTST